MVQRDIRKPVYEKETQGKYEFINQVVSNHDFTEDLVTLYDNKTWHGYRRTQNKYFNLDKKFQIPIFFDIFVKY